MQIKPKLLHQNMIMKHHKLFKNDWITLWITVLTSYGVIIQSVIESLSYQKSPKSIIKDERKVTYRLHLASKHNNETKLKKQFLKNI